MYKDRSAGATAERSFPYHDKYKVKAAIGTDGPWKNVTAVLDTKAGPNPAQVD